MAVGCSLETPAVERDLGLRNTQQAPPFKIQTLVPKTQIKCSIYVYSMQCKKKINKMLISFICRTIKISFICRPKIFFFRYVFTLHGSCWYICHKITIYIFSCSFYKLEEFSKSVFHLPFVFYYDIK